MKYNDYNPLSQKEILETPTAGKCFLYRIVPIVAWSGVVGIVVGILATLFNWILEESAALAVKIGNYMHTHTAWIPLYLAGMVGVAMFMYWFTKVLPEARGSGIPRTEAMMCGKKELRWWKLCVATFVGSTVSFVSGIPVGAEGPSVQFGGGLGAGLESASGSKGKHYIANSGVAAGVASAFIAPYTGLVFAIEEVQRKFDPLMIMAGAVSVCYAYLMRLAVGGLLGMKTVFFAAQDLVAVPLRLIWIAIPIGIVAALVARLFNASILTADKCSAHSKLPRWIPLLSLLGIVSLCNLMIPDNIGSGSVIIGGILTNSYDWGILLLLFVLKFALVVWVFRAAPTGGMMVPMLAIGTMLGALIGQVAVACGMPSEYVPMLALVTMAAFFGSCIKAPITVVALFAETTGRTDMLALATVAIFVMQAVSVCLRQRALYDTLWERDIHRTGEWRRYPNGI